MKKNPCIRSDSPRHLRRNSKSGVLKKICKSFKSSLNICDDARFGLPPMAPHNTTQDIIDCHPIVPSDIEELLGSCPGLLDSIVLPKVTLSRT